MNFHDRQNNVLHACAKPKNATVGLGIKLLFSSALGWNCPCPKPSKGKHFQMHFRKNAFCSRVILILNNLIKLFKYSYLLFSN